MVQRGRLQILLIVVATDSTLQAVPIVEVIQVAAKVVVIKRTNLAKIINLLQLVPPVPRVYSNLSINKELTN